MFNLKQYIDSVIAALLANLMPVEWAQVVSLIVSVNVLTGFIVALYALMIAEAVRWLERRVGVLEDPEQADRNWRPRLTRIPAPQPSPAPDPPQVSGYPDPMDYVRITHIMENIMMFHNGTSIRKS